MDSDQLEVLAEGARPLAKILGPFFDAVEAVRNYLWEKERADFSARPMESHIFSQLVVIENLLTGQQRTAAEYAEGE